LNVLFQHAHDSGRLTDSEAEWQVPLAVVRENWSRHKGNERIHDSLTRLMRVIVNVPYISPKGGEQRVMRTHLLDFTDTSADESAGRGTLTFGIPKKLRPILARSERWGRIKATVICSMSSKYAIALYELVQARAEMEQCLEVVPIDKLRALLGVPPSAYEDGSNFRLKVVEPALLEVNGLSDMGVEIELRRKHPRAAIHEAAVAWWKKEGDEFRAALAERNRPKVGRKARLRGEVQKVEPTK
jgi:hypothetical protein